MIFFIGWHQPNSGPSGAGCFEHSMISVNRLLSRRSPFAVQNWIMDSGAFTRIASGVGHLPVESYAKEVLRWQNNGKMLAAVTQDYMCEEFILRKTGLTVEQHQKLTIERYDSLLSLLAGKIYLMPVLQGYSPHSYQVHLQDYGDRLPYGAWVGVGSVCKRNGNPSAIAAVLLAIKSVRSDLRLHGFGLKKSALTCGLINDLLYSADSQAHGLIAGSGSKKYVGANDPMTALNYARSIASQPLQMSIFAT